ncbi:histidine kinase, partial [Acinetobacter baumannii]
IGFVVVAIVLGGIGLLLRAAQARGERLDEQLERSREREQAAAALERRRLAGDLHDGIAHDLTVIALHAQLLDDPDDAVRQTAQATI